MQILLNERLIETTSPFFGHRQVSLRTGTGRLTLGTHPVAETLRGLSVSAQSFMTMSYLDAYMVLPAGSPIGRADAYTGYVGADRLRGRLTVQYPHSEAIDQYAVARAIPG